MFRAFFVLAVSCALLGAANVRAQHATYRCVDSGGRSTYTNVKEEMTGKKCTIVSREVSVVPVPPPPPAAKAARRSANGIGARVDETTQRSRDHTRLRILRDELDAAEKRLAESRQKLAQQESTRSSEEKINPQRADARLKPHREEVERQEQNVASLKRELANLR